MTLQEFQSAVNPLVNRFKKNYTGDVMDLIYSEVRSITMEQFKSVVAYLNGTMRFAPMVPDFRDALLKLNIRPSEYSIGTQAVPKQNEDFLYHLRDNIWATNDYLYIRGHRHAFIVKSHSPENPLVIEDAEKRSQRISLVKKHLENGTYRDYVLEKEKLEEVSHERW